MVLTKKPRVDPAAAARVECGVEEQSTEDSENQEVLGNQQTNLANSYKKPAIPKVHLQETEDDECSSSSEESSDDDDDFMANLTEEQKKLIAEKTKAMQSKYSGYVQEQAKTKLEDVMNATGVTKEEAQIALECCNNDEIEAAGRLREDTFRDYLHDIVEEQKQIKATGSTTKISVFINEDGVPERRKTFKKSTASRRSTSTSSVVSGFNMNGDKRAKTLRLGEALKKLERIKKEKQAQKTSTSTEAEGTTSESDSDNQNRQDASVVESSSPSKVESTTDSKPRASSTGSESETTDRNENTNVNVEATTEKVEVEYSYEDLKGLEWSEARIKAFLNRKQNPNAYYYRFNAPGEKQATGEWSREESKLFMELIKDGVDYRWGVLSMEIPGRVGYQCSNYYRKLILNGQVEDPNYSVDESGKLKFTRPKGKPRVVPTQTGKSNSSTISAASKLRKRLSGSDRKAAPKRKKKRARRRRAGDEYTYADEVDSDSENERTIISNSKVVRPEDEVIPGLRCPMTMEPMDDPALSPYGHVMSYATWIRVLSRAPKNLCPFTKQKMTRRSLVKLTKENVNEYMDKIVHVQGVGETGSK